MRPAAHQASHSAHQWRGEAKRAERAPGVAVYKTQEQDHGIASAFDQQLIELCRPALERGEPVKLSIAVRNIHRTVGTMLAGEVTRRHGAGGLPEGTIKVRFEGTAGRASAASW